MKYLKFMKKLIILLLSITIFLPFNLFGQPPKAFLPKYPIKKKPIWQEGREFKEGRKFKNSDNYTPVSLTIDELTISISEKIGTIKPLLGVNAGPTPSGEQGNADLTEQYQTYGINAVRTHDFYGPFDLSQIYPNINAPPENPSSYNFSASDEIFEKIIQTGCMVYLRVGDSYNNVRIPGNPQERSNLTRAAVEVVRHYKKMADTLKRKSTSIMYVEIWNEPDFNHFWSAGLEDFQGFFIETFLAMKREFPDIKIGGPGFAVPSYKMSSDKEKTAHFLEALKENSISPDFLSFHLYSNNPNEFYDIVKYYRSLLKNTGIENCELHITEWNTDRMNTDISLITGEKTASYFTASWIALQKAEVDMSFIYRCTDTSPDFEEFYGIFYADGRPKPSATALKLCSEFSAYQNKVILHTGIPTIDSEPQPETQPSPIWLIGGEKETGEKAILITNISSQEYKITLDNSFKVKYINVSEIQGTTDIKEYIWKEKTITIPANSVLLLEIPKRCGCSFLTL